MPAGSNIIISLDVEGGDRQPVEVSRGGHLGQVHKDSPATPFSSSRFTSWRTLFSTARPTYHRFPQATASISC